MTQSLCNCLYTYLGTCVEFRPTHLSCASITIFAYVLYLTLTLIVNMIDQHHFQVYLCFTNEQFRLGEPSPRLQKNNLVETV